MEIKAIRTKIFMKGENLEDFILEQTDGKIREKSILFITSKIISLAEGRTVSPDRISKKDLVQKESEYYLGEIGYGCHLAICHGLLVPSAGIDESNSKTGDYILYPKAPFSSANKIRNFLKERLNLKDLGIIVTDSRTLPLRKGVVGMALAYSGFKALNNLMGEKDLFGRQLRMTAMNLADGLASAAVALMGEGAQRRPLAIAWSAPVEFGEQDHPSELKMNIEEDLYKPLYYDRIQNKK